MALTELFAADLATTTVSSGGTDAPASGTAETWTVASSAMFGAASTGISQFHVADAATGKGTEIIAVTNVSGTTWTVTRGAESTTPVTHTAGFTIYQVVTTGFLGGLATLASPVFTGTPAAPTASALTDSTQIATTAYADSAVAVETGRAETAEALTLPLAGGTLTGSVGVPLKTVTTTNITLTSDCVTLCNASGGGFTNTLPDATAVRAGAPYLFKKADTSVNEVKLLPVSSQTVDGASYYVLAAANATVTLRSDGSNWWVF